MSHRHGSSFIDGAYVFGTGGLGIPAEDIPSSGDNGPGYAYPSLSLPADNGKEICGTVTTWPTDGTLEVYEDTGYQFSGAADGSYWFEWQLKVDGIPVGLPVRSWLQVGPAYAQIAATTDGTTFSGSSVVSGSPATSRINAVLDDVVFSGRSVGAVPFTQDQIDFMLAYIQENLVIPTAEQIAAAVLAALSATTIPVDVKKVNAVTLTGDGTTGNPMRPS